MNKKEEFIVRHIGDDFVMMPIGQTALKFNGLIMANEVSAFIWENLDKVSDANEMSLLICEDFNVDYETALHDVKELFDQMRNAGWIE